MERRRKFIDKLLVIAPGGVYGILSVIARIFCDFFAYLFFPGYSIFSKFLKFKIQFNKLWINQLNL